MQILKTKLGFWGNLKLWIFGYSNVSFLSLFSWALLHLFTDESLTPGSPQAITQEENHTYLSIGWGWAGGGQELCRARQAAGVGTGGLGGRQVSSLLGWGWAWGLDSSWRVKQSGQKGRVQEMLWELSSVTSIPGHWPQWKWKSEAGWAHFMVPGGGLAKPLVCPDRSLKAETLTAATAGLSRDSTLSFTVLLETIPPSNLLSLEGAKQWPSPGTLVSFWSKLESTVLNKNDFLN